jgi:hypothetical protein
MSHPRLSLVMIVMRIVLAMAVLLLAPGPVSAAGFAVVELFTSEGCSSCPPADRLLADLARRPGVYALEFHVDYWNSLGWRDPYSAAAYTRRQQAYGDDIYTPQMVVNGTNLFVGSNRQRAEAAIAAALQTKPKVTLTATRNAEGIAYHATNAPEGARLCVAIVDAHRSTKVLKGENEGLTLDHARVVRGFSDVACARDGTVPYPAAVKTSEVVVFVQAAHSGEILAAASP